MSLILNGKNPESITIGGNAVESIAINGEIVWQIGADITPYFFIRNDYQGANTLTVKKNPDSVGNYPNTGLTLEYSYDKATWTPLTYINDECSIPLTNYHDIVYLRSSDGFSGFPFTPAWYSLDCTGSFIVGGDIKTLIDYTDSNISTIPQASFYKMFINSTTITSVATLHFNGITTINQYAMQEMFYNSSLDTPFDLPNVVILGENAMKSCFEDCTFLNHVPNMPSLAVLGKSALSHAFENCTSITSAPLLQDVAAIGNSALLRCFENCTSMTTGPNFHNLTHIGPNGLDHAFASSGLAVMPNFSVVNRIDQYGMAHAFVGCHSLTTGFSMPLLDTVNQNAFENTFDACDALVTTPDLSGVRIVGQDGMKYMFKGCVSLIEGVQLKDITTIYSGQGTGGMNHLYDGCTSLNKVWAPTPATWNTDAMEDWLNNVASVGVVLKDDNLTIPLNSTSGVPINWTAQSNTHRLYDFIHKDPLSSSAYQWDNPVDAVAIVTGIQPTQNMSFRVKFRYMGVDSGAIFFGSPETNDYNDWRFFNVSGSCYFDLANDRLSMSGLLSGTDYDLTIGNFYVYDNINQSYWRQSSTKTLTNIQNFPPMQADIGRVWLHSFEVFDDNGTTVFNGVAAEANGVVGLLDSVTNQIFTNTNVTIIGENPI